MAPQPDGSLVALRRSRAAVAWLARALCHSDLVTPNIEVTEEVTEGSRVAIRRGKTDQIDAVRLSR